MSVKRETKNKTPKPVQTVGGRGKQKQKEKPRIKQQAAVPIK